MKFLNSKVKTVLAAAVLGAGSALFYACNQVGDGLGLDDLGNPKSAVAPETTLAALVQPIFNSRCIACHAQGGLGWTPTGGATGGLDLTSGHSYDLLVNYPTFQKPTQNPVVRVKPGSADSSYLYQKIASSTPKEGTRMPQGGTLSASEINIIKRWIEKGAPQ